MKSIGKPLKKMKGGQEDFIEKWYISGVHKKRGVITEFLIEKTQLYEQLRKNWEFKLGY